MVNVNRQLGLQWCFFFCIHIVATPAYNHIIILNDDNDIDLFGLSQEKQLSYNMTQKRRVARNAADMITLMDDGSGTSEDETFASFPTTITAEASTTIIVIINSTTFTTTTTAAETTTATTVATSMPDICNNDTHTMDFGSCRSKADIQEEAAEILRTNSTNASTVSAALSQYIHAITNYNVSSNGNNTVSIAGIDASFSRIVGGNETINTNTSLIIIRSIEKNALDHALGAFVLESDIGEAIYTSNQNRTLANESLFTAAHVDDRTIVTVTSLKILIINDPTPFTRADNSTNNEIASALVVFSLERAENTNATTNVLLYFQLFNKSRRHTDGEYRCSSYNTTTSTWDEYGCTKAKFRKDLNRFECQCNHNTTFALIWLPKTPLTRHLNAQDIVSLVFQCISVVCFIIVISHALGSQVCRPYESIEARILLPLIAGASTALLFVFYIALAMTVYTHTPSDEADTCFLSSSVLMFVTYFLLILMFCVKTSVGYFNYLRFVHLFPEPSYRKLCLMLAMSFVVSMACVAVAVGLHYSSSFAVIQLKPYKLCWFTPDVIYYFLTAPVCIFLFINVVISVIVGSRIVSHVRNATSPHQSYERMKRCVIVLLSSSITQGLGWLIGPFIAIDNLIAQHILSWFFVVLNALEGLWTIILYIIIRSQHMDQRKRLTAQKQLKKAGAGPWSKSGQKHKTYLDETKSRRFPRLTERQGKKLKVSHLSHEM